MKKFRAWDKDNKTMHYDDFIIYPDGRWCLQDDYNFWGKDLESSEYLMMFTGLYDANGKEIYENDIIRIDDKNLLVKYMNSTFTIGDSVPLLIFVKESKVVGNIHENQELFRELSNDK